MKNQPRNAFPLCLSILALFLAGCASTQKSHSPGTHSPRAGDEIVAAGQFFHTGTPVVLWLDPGGYDAYRVERRFAPFDKSDWEDSAAAVKDLTTPNRYGLRASGLTWLEREEVRGGGWDLLRLQDTVDQFVLHYDVAGTSRQCFKILHDHRCLSVHFMLDLDGTIYQTLDLKERAWHASVANTRSIGIEIANIGAYRDGNPLKRWYKKDSAGHTHIEIPAAYQPTGIRTPRFIARPIRPEPISGEIQGQPLLQYDLTSQQYEALSKLTATLCRIFPNLPLDYPRDASGNLIRSKLPDDQLKSHRGLIGHYHIQSNKVDPGPAFQWDKLLHDARQHLGE